MSAVAKLVYFGRSAAQGLRHAPFVHFIAVLTLSIALFGAGLARGAAGVLDAAVAQLGGEVEVTVYLADDVDAARVEALQASIEARTGGTAKVVPPAEALGRLAQELGEVGEVLADLPSNPLPASLELSVPPGLRGPASLADLASALREEPGVTAVDYGQEAVERLQLISRALRTGGWVAFVIAVIATVVVVSATLQLAIYARRSEIEIQKLVGATERFVKVPFLIEGLLQGALGGLVAVGALWAFSLFALPTLSATFSFLVGPGGPPPLLTPALALELLGAGLLLGLGGSFVAVGRFSRA